MTRVAVVKLGRAAAMGEATRVAAWRRIFSEAGAEVHEVALLPTDGVLRPSVRPADLPLLVAGRIVPETAAWSFGGTRAALAAIDPAVVVFVTARAFRPGLAPPQARIVLDFVDELSTSYRDRARIDGGLLRPLGFRLLGRLHRRFEQRQHDDVVRVAAGYGDAQRLGAEWVPVLAPVLDDGPPRPALADAIFIGNLSYGPNVGAIRWLDRLWPRVVTRRPGTSLLLAGRSPERDVVEMVARHGWRLLENFDRLEDLRGIARVAVAPLAMTAGIQNKVLDAAALRLPQLVTPAALRGFAPGFPADVADSEDEFVTALVALLDDPERGAAMAEAAAAHLRSHYDAPAWAGWATKVLSRG